MSNPNTPDTDRRTVKGLAFRTCDFCARERTDKNGKPFNYQYRNPETGVWDSGVYCSKICAKAWHSMNG